MTSISQGTADIINNSSPAMQAGGVGTHLKEALDSMLAPPDAWEVQSYTAGDQVTYNDKLWFANANTDSSDVPGVSSKWTAMGSGNVLSVGGNTGTVVALKTNAIDIVDPTTPTKKIGFLVSGATAAKKLTIVSAHTNDRSITIPDATDTLVGKATTDTMTNKTLTAPVVTGWQTLGDYADDAAAAVGGVAVGGMYRTTSTLKVRVA